jgi:hypothetical protein
MDEMAREIGKALDHDFPKLKHAPHPAAAGGRPPSTVSDDIEALKAKLDTILRGLEILRGQI